MQKEFDIREESRVIKEKILNFTNLIVALVVLPLLVLSLLRVTSTGMRFDHVVHIFVVFSLWMLFLLRSKVKFEIRILLFIVSLMILIVPSVLFYEALDYWGGYVAILYSYLTGLFFGKKWGGLSVAYTFVCLSIGGYLLMIGSNAVGSVNEVEPYILHNFLYNGILLLSVSLIIVLLIDKYRAFFLRTLSDLIEAKENTEKHEHKYKQLSSLTFEGIVIHDKGIIIDVNQSLARMLGYSPDELIGKRLINSEFLPEKYHKLIYDNMAKNYAFPYEVEGMRKDGTLWPVEIESRNIEPDGRSTLRVTAIRDVTERKKNVQKLIDKNNQLIAAEEKLRAYNEELLKARESVIESELLYKGIVENLMGGYYRADAEGKLIIASSSAEAILGFPVKDFLGQSITLFYVNPAERDSFIEQIKRDGKVYKFATEFKTKNRGNIIVETNAKVIYNNKGEYNGVEGVFYDVTEDIKLKKKWEEELILAKEKAEEGDQLKTMFLQNMSHEIRTPLNAILGFSSFIDDPELPAEERELYSDIIQKSGNQLLQIVDEIMEMSMLETKTVSLVEEPVCINALLHELYQMFEMKVREKNLKFNLNKTLKDKQSTLITDKAKLTKILRNLLENAIKYTDSGFVEYGYSQEGNKMVFYVKDSGIGILPENQKKIFDRFIQESEDLSDIKGGLGLGLSITKENVTLLGGEISLKSQFGKGTEFYVTIPYKKSSKENMGNC